MSAPDREAMLALAAAYALGALEGEERAAFEAFLATDAEAQREVAAYRAVAGEAAAVHAAGPAPAPALHDRVLATVPRAAGGGAPPVGGAPVTPLRPREGGRVSPVWWTAVAASIAVILTLAVQLNDARRLAAEASQQVAALEAKLASREAEVNALLEPSVQLIRLRGADTTGTVIQLFVNGNRSEATVHAFRLPPAPAGKAYQLWLIEDGKAPMPSVTFNTESSGHGLVQGVKVPAGARFALAAVTLEPEGGSAAPTSPILCSGAFPKS